VNPAGKTALITGGAWRVGRAITLALARAGADVVINYHSSAEAAQETAAEARALGAEALPYQADVADLDQVRALVAAAQERFGVVDVLVNSASLFAKTPVPVDEFETWRRVLRISLDGPFYLANLLAPAMRERGEGAIVNLVDLAAWEPWRGFAAHSVGKAGLLALTRQLALEFSPAVRVNAVAPGRVLPPQEFTAGQIERGAQRSLLGRWGTPDDAAQAVLFLVRSDYITGEVIVVDGGERYTPP
jgi:NAD(P)-dependent dehydrogenase (short-subunit alcohol dehydrogenase family)